MYWREPPAVDRYHVPDEVVDVAFSIACAQLPLDHAHALFEAVAAALPWLADEPAAGIHPIHGAASGNGWYRPDATRGDVLNLAKRTRLVLRLPRERVQDAAALSGNTLLVDGHAMSVGAYRVRALSTQTTLFARFVVDAAQRGEDAFAAELVDELRDCGITVHKLLCGREHSISTPAKPLRTRSVMLADLDVAHSVRLQQLGAGPGRQLGCGLFIPHKDIGAPQGGDDAR